MVAGGVRSNAALPAMPRKQLKAQMRALKAEAKAEAKAAQDAKKEPKEPAEVDAAFTETDWSSPWWEDRQPTAVAD